MGPEIENVGFSFVLPILFEGSRWPKAFQENERPAGKYSILVFLMSKQLDFLIKNALWLYAELCHLLGREHIVGTIIKKCAEK